MPKQDSSLSFLAGAAKTKDWIILAGQLNVRPEGSPDATRMNVLKAGQWGHFDLPGVLVRSVYANSKPAAASAAYFLGRRGQVVAVLGGDMNTETIKDAGTGRGKLGYLNQIRLIADKLYVCGLRGQVYRREDNGWQHVDQELVEPPDSDADIDLLSIDGISPSNLYTVGAEGAAFHFDGRAWRRLGKPTEKSLTWVRCVSPKEAYVCGRKGTLLKLSDGHWDVLTDTAFSDDFWCVESFNDEVYVASLKDVFVLKGKKLERTDAAKTAPKPDAFRLDAKDGVLWSFGQRYVCFFDGKKWTYVAHPDNP
jgi:photosystem II stability/assembly factor-like uncharacterized protein